MRHEIVGQREFGIFTPDDRDISLHVLGMSSCFAVSIQDTSFRYGFITHADFEDDLAQIVMKGMSLLDPPVSQRFKIRTINARNHHVGFSDYPEKGKTSYHQRQTKARLRRIEEVSDLLTYELHMHLVGQSADLGSAFGASISHENSIKLIHLWDPLPFITKEQRNRMVHRTHKIRRLYDRNPYLFIHNSRYRPAFRCAYQSPSTK